MAIAAREVKNKRDSNGILTGHSGLVYDVNIKYKIGKQSKTYVKKGFLTKKEAYFSTSFCRFSVDIPLRVHWFFYFSNPIILG